MVGLSILLVGLSDRYGGAVQSPFQKEQPYSPPGKTIYAQIANFLQEICITSLLKHIYTTLMGLPDILRQHNFSTEVSPNGNIIILKKMVKPKWGWSDDMEKVFSSSSILALLNAFLAILSEI